MFKGIAETKSVVFLGVVVRWQLPVARKLRFLTCGSSLEHGSQRKATEYFEFSLN